jgi:ATP-dependent DNA helicase RecG
VSVGQDSSLKSVVGDKTATALEKTFGYTSVADLLAHYPRRYATRGELTSIAGIPVGEVATLVAEVVSTSKRVMKSRKGSVLEVTITDGTGLVTLTFFNQAWREKDLIPGARGIFAGKVGLYRNQRQLAHPDYELFTAEELTQAASEEWAKRPIPFYPASQKLASWQIARAISVVLDVLDDVVDPLPEALIASEGLLPLREAWEKIHRPSEDQDWQRARDTLRFHEAFVLQVALVARRRHARSFSSTKRVRGALTHAFLERLPFSLTTDQNTVLQEVEADMATGHPMIRLLQGEVGSGKTVVSLAAMVLVAESGGQTALLAPTEVLAWQHYRSIVKTLGPELSAKLNPTLLTGALRQGEKKKALLAAASGLASIVVGTHALLADKVSFVDLGLVVIDEQHRFGVDQREALRQKGVHPHVLVLTATPIPRTVAMTVFGDLDVSTIRTLPEGRSPISTHVVALADNPTWLPRVWKRLAEEVSAGRQGFVVVPAISPGEPEEGEFLEESESLEPKKTLATVEQTLPYLQSLPEFAPHRLAGVHGQMASEEKESVMQAFASGEVDVLVATTVIEVGIDVPNATVMVIVDADRFGVSQLHQLRGRVGRGSHPGVCLLVTHCDPETTARARVDAVAGTTDGFELSALDLELRSEGDVLGSRQSGRGSGLTLLRAATHQEVIEHARALAEALLESDENLAGHSALVAEINRRLDEDTAEYLAKN